MTTPVSSGYQFLGPYFYVGLALGIAHWVLDATLVTFLFKQGQWLEQLVRPDKHSFYVRTVTLALFAFSGGLVNYLAASRTIRAREQEELTNILENSLNEIYIFDAVTLKFQLVNFGARKNLGYSWEQFQNLTPVDIKPDFTTEAFKSLLTELVDSDRKKITFKTRHRRANNTEYPVEVHLQQTRYAQRPAFVAIILDTTERDQLETDKQRIREQILHSQKLESLGILAGGIAHDFNNLLVAILGNADLALNSATKHQASLDHLSDIVDATQKAAGLCNQLLAYSGKGRFVVRPVNLSTIVQEMWQLLKVSVSKNVTLNHEAVPNLLAIEADETQIQQILMNLITNASEAIGDKNGIVTITTGAMDCDSAYLRDTFVDETLPPGRYVFLEVTDTGTGINEHTRAQIFDPFFTSKFKGRGLGLAAVLGIVRGHRGAIRVYSELNKGSSFKLLFPVTDQPAEEIPKTETATATWQGTGTALIVDDDELVQQVAKQFFRTAGFETLTASDGLEGLKLFRDHQEEIVVVLLDMTMPKMNGSEAFREIRRIDATIPVILSSGYNEQETTSHLAGKGLAGFIQKPYRMNEFLTIVQQAVSRQHRDPF